MDKALLKKTLIGIITNPIIIGIAAGLLWSALKLPMPVILHKAVSSIGGVATPMGLMAMGATFDIKKAFGKIKPTVIAAFIQISGICRSVHAACGSNRIQERETDRNLSHAWFSNHGQQLCHG